jgi:hypothetical protein
MVFAPLTRRKPSFRTEASSGARVSAPRSILCNLLPFDRFAQLSELSVSLRSAVACLSSFSTEQLPQVCREGWGDPPGPILVGKGDERILQFSILPIDSQISKHRIQLDISPYLWVESFTSNKSQPQKPMKIKMLPLTIAMLGSLALPASGYILVPNGDFSLGNEGWAQNGGGVVQRPADTFPTGGNPGGYAIVTPSDGTVVDVEEVWGILVGPALNPNNASGPGWDLSLFGLKGGDSITVRWDSINLGVGNTGPTAGAVGGMKIEGWANNAIVGETSGDRFVPTIGTGATWESYSTTWTLPANAQQLVLVPLWAGGVNRSTVGFDNVGVVPEPSTYALLALGAAGLGAHLVRRRRR